MGIRHTKQSGGRVSMPGASFTVGEDGMLSPDPSKSQIEYLLRFDGMFELVEPKKPEPKKPEPKKPEPKKPEPKKPEPKKPEPKKPEPKKPSAKNRGKK